MSHGASERASFVAELGEELFDKPIVLPEGELSQEYSWQPRMRPWQNRSRSLFFVFTEQQNFLPPHAEDYKDPDTRKAFNDYIKERQPDTLYVTLPPMPEKKYHNLRPRARHPTERNDDLQSWNRTILSRSSRGYEPYCLTHENKDTHKERIAQQVNDFRHFREFRKWQEVQRICMTLFGSASANSSVCCPHLAGTYWRDENEIIASRMNVDYYNYTIGDLVTKKFLPPKATDLVIPESCAEFDEYVKVADPELIYTTISPLSQPIPCQYTDCKILPSKEYESRQCPLHVPSGSQAILHRLDKGHYELWCLGHDSLDVHTEYVNKQEKDIHSRRQINNERTATAKGNTTDTSDLSYSDGLDTEDFLQHYRANYGDEDFDFKHEDAYDQR